MTDVISPLNYEKSGAAIYAQSFATVQAEANLDRFPQNLRPAIIRMIHACGMVEIADRIAYDPAIVDAVQNALHHHGVVFCDCQMVRAGIITRYLPNPDACRVTINDADIPELAQALQTTRSAAQVQTWLPHLAGAIVVIGNAPTALFHLLELLDKGAPKPAAIIACPVGFVGAAESKAELAANPRGVPFLTLRGRCGGSAIAAAGLNGLAAGLPEIA